MQLLWARILAGEFSQPGKYSPRTLHTLRSLNRADAELFQRYCRYVWFVKNYQKKTRWHGGLKDGQTTIEYAPDQYRFIHLVNAVFYVRDQGISEQDDVHLQNLGLINLRRYRDAVPFDGYYFGEGYSFEVVTSWAPPARILASTHGTDVTMDALTDVGCELAPISGGSPDPKFLDIFLKATESIFRIHPLGNSAAHS